LADQPTKSPIHPVKNKPAKGTGDTNMAPAAMASIVFVCVFGGALLGLGLRNILPEDHLSQDTKDVVKLGMGVVATMAALVLGLLIASAKESYDAQSRAVTQMSANFILVDRLLAHYGPETKGARDRLRGTVALVLDRLWPHSAREGVQLAPTASAESFFDEIANLEPKNDAQRALRDRALQLSSDIGQTHWLLVEQSALSIPSPFVALLILWLSVLFSSFALFAPPNSTVVATMLLCAISVSTAIFLILELQRPFGGLIQLSSAPLQSALANLSQ
jgi:hypothetical protein